MRDESPRPDPRCPHCASTRVEVISLFGSQAVTAQYRCAGCGDCFEALKYVDESSGVTADLEAASHEPRTVERQ
jgi:transposase-like protein